MKGENRYDPPIEHEALAKRRALQRKMRQFPGKSQRQGAIRI